MMIDETLQMIARAGIFAGVFGAMLAMGTSLTFRQILAPLRDVRTLALALIANFVAVPVLALVLSRLLPLTTEARTALILLGTMAGAPFLPKLAVLASGQVPFSVDHMVVMMIVTIGYAPLVLPRVLEGVTIESSDIARSLIVIMLLPLALGLVTRTRYPRVADWSPSLAHISGAGMAFGLAAGLLVGWRDLLATIGSWILIGTALLGIGAVAIGWLLGSWTPPDRRRVAALGTATRNVTAALLVAGTDFGADTLVMTMAASIMLMVVLVVTAGEMGRMAGRGVEESRSREGAG